ncbi:MAG: HDOD domain-containing protein [Myxococcales bacterium]|nr:HDOD domain-containing protein [Myxococcales bacterium]
MSTRIVGTVEARPGPNASQARMAAVLERSKELHDIVNSSAVAAAVGSIDALPTVPRIYLELRDLTARPDTGAAEIANAVASDPALSLKLLQLVNSVGFGMRRRVASVQQAVALLGMEQIKALVLSSQVFSNAAKCRVQCFSLEQFQDCSMRVGRLAQAFMAKRGIGAEAFTAGLLIDVGKLVLAMAQPDAFTEVLLRTAESNEDAETVEREIIGVTHSEAGAYLLWQWGLPISTVECVAFHHRADLMKQGPYDLVAAVHAADAIYDILACGEPPSRLNLTLLERAGVLGELGSWREQVAESLE